MTDRDPWYDDFEQRGEESQRRFEASERQFYEGLRRLDRHFVWYLIGIAAVWLGVGLAIKSLP
ncbi:hypothetical protein [Halochromatium sp.]